MPHGKVTDSIRTRLLTKGKAATAAYFIRIAARAIKKKKKYKIFLVLLKLITTFANAKQKGHGALSERLGNGLQNRSRRFDSARHLRETY